MIKSNLEPIEERDLDIEGKLNGTRAENIPMETPYAVEQEKPQEIIGAEKDNAYGNILAKVQAQSIITDIDQQQVSSDAQQGAQLDAQTQVQHLVDIAAQKGVIHAVKVARHMEDNYILDKFHDRMLADELHDALVQKGMLKEI